MKGVLLRPLNPQTQPGNWSSRRAAIDKRLRRNGRMQAVFRAYGTKACPGNNVVISARRQWQPKMAVHPRFELAAHGRHAGLTIVRNSSYHGPPEWWHRVVRRRLGVRVCVKRACGFVRAPTPVPAVWLVMVGQPGVEGFTSQADEGVVAATAAATRPVVLSQRRPMAGLSAR